MSEELEQKQEIPAALKITPSQLAANDAEQAEWRERFNSPLASHTPKERERASAVILIETLENARQHQELTDTQREQLAESYASIGEYERAAQISSDAARVAEYEKYWEAVWRDDDEWCAHPDIHKYRKDFIFSVKDDQEMPLLACNVCGTWNVADAPETLIEASRQRAQIRQATKGMPIEAAKRYLENNRKLKF